MNETIKNYAEAREALRTAKRILRQTKGDAQRFLADNLPQRNAPVTAAQIGAKYGMDSHDVAALLKPYRRCKECVTRHYVLYNPDTGEVDTTKRVVKSYLVNGYSR